MNTGRSIKKDLVLSFGDRDDGVIGIPCLTRDGLVVEASYFFGKTRPKNIVVISSQAGCPMKCSFCELGSERFVRNLTAEEIRDQAAIVLEEAARHGFDAQRDPHKITVANSGEPLLNPRLVDGLELLSGLSTSFKVSTIFPDAKTADATFERLAAFAARHPLPVQLQISLISTSERERSRIAGGRVAGFAKIRRAAGHWRRTVASDRKINLSLILTEDMPADAGEIAAAFPPDLFRFRFRQYVPTRNGTAQGLSLIAAPRLAAVKQAFAEKGYEVGDWGSPSPAEWRFGLAGNVIRRMYLDMTTRPSSP